MNDVANKETEKCTPLLTGMIYAPLLTTGERRLDAR